MCACRAFRSGLFTMILVAGACGTLAAQQATVKGAWTRTDGPYNTTLSSVSMRPGKPDEFLLVVNGEIYLTVDRGRTYAPVGSAADFLWRHPYDANAVLTQMTSSSDGGRTWTPVARSQGRLAAFARNPKLLYAITSVGDEGWMEAVEALRSKDGGTTFETRGRFGESPGQIPGRPVSLSVDAVDSSLLFAIATLEEVASAASLVLYKSRDGGARWVRIPTPDPDQRAWSVACDPFRGGSLMLLEESGVYRSADGGQTWEYCLSGGSWWGELWFDPTRQGVVWVRASDRIYRSANGGSTWAELKGPWTGTGSINGFSADSDAPRCLVTTSLGTLYRTDDGGRHWTELEVPRLLADLTHGGGTLAVDPVDSSRAYVGLCCEGPAFRTTNGGQTWSVMYGWGSVRIALHPEDPSHLYIVGGEDGRLKVSHDYGMNWLDAGDFRRDAGLRPDQRSTSIAFVSGAPGRIYLGTYSSEATDASDPASWGQLVTSADGGQSWSLVPFRKPNKEIIGIAAKPGLRDSIIVVTSDYDVFLSTDGGGSWSESLAVEAETAYAAAHFVTSDPRNPDLVALVVASTPIGARLYLTEDFGRSWSECTPPGFSVGGGSVVLSHPSARDTRIIAAGGRPDGRLWVSDDLGMSWGMVSTGIADGLFIVGVSGDGVAYATSGKSGVVKGRLELPAAAGGASHQ